MHFCWFRKTYQHQNIRTSDIMKHVFVCSVFVCIFAPVPPSTDAVKLYDDNNPFGYNNTNEKTDDVLEGEPHHLTCFVEATRPEPNVAWKLNGEIQSNGIETTSVQNPGESQFRDTTSVFTFTPDCSTYNLKEVTCETNIHEAPTEVITKGVTLQLNSKFKDSTFCTDFPLDVA